MDDEAYRSIFRPVISKIMEVYRPGAIVLQCGADSLSGDRLGCFNLSVKGHGECVEFVRSFDLPLLVLGGGGYTLRTVPRCWTYETSVLVGQPIQDELPFNDYFDYYGPDYRLHLPVSNMDNLNTATYLEKTKMQLLEVLRSAEPVPSAQLQTGQVESQLNPRGMDLSPTPADDQDDEAKQGQEDEPKTHTAELAS